MAGLTQTSYDVRWFRDLRGGQVRTRFENTRIPARSLSVGGEHVVGDVGDEPDVVLFQGAEKAIRPTHSRIVIRVFSFTRRHARRHP